MEVGDNTNHGKIIWLDKQWHHSDGTPADIIVKTDEPNKAMGVDFTFLRASEITVIYPF